MKRIISALALLLLLSSCSSNSLKMEVAVSAADYDFSEVFTFGTPFRLGIIGEDYSRLQMHFASVTKADAELYAVKGFSKVGDNVQLFEGTIQIVSIQKQEPEKDENGEVVPTDHINNHDVYLLECQYEFNQADGVFEGKCYNEIYFNDGKAFTDDCYSGADGYDNNYYKGTFTSNIGLRKGQNTVANWGVFRIPDSGDLDQGVGEFIPSEKYRDNGWVSYYNYSIFNNGEGEEAQLAKVNATFEECRQWWDPEAPKLKAEIRGLTDDSGKSFEGSRHFIVTATTSAGEHTYSFSSMYPPEYQDINFDGYRDIYQLGDEGRNDEGTCYLYNQQTKEFENCPSFCEILQKGYIALFPSEKVLMTSHNFWEKGEIFYYLYRFEEGKFILAGTVMEKDNIYREYDRNGNQIREANYIAELSRVWAICFAN